MASPVVSVVIPTYYRNDALRGAIESARSQSYTPVEVIVVDDSGEGHAEPVAADYDLIYVALDENRGAHAARNAGLDRATGDYVQFLDDDDRLLADKLEQQVTLLESQADVGVVYCGLVWEGGLTVYPKSHVRGDVLEAALRFDTAPCMMGTMLIDCSVLDRISPFRHTHGADDIGMKIELAQKTRFDFVDEILVQRGDTPGSLGSTQAAVDGRWEILETYTDLYEQFPPDVRRSAVAETHFAQGQVYINDRLWSLKAIEAFAHACYHVPELPLPYGGSLVASCLGRPAYRVFQTIYSRYMAGDDRRGKNI